MLPHSSHALCHVVTLLLPEFRTLTLGCSTRLRHSRRHGRRLPWSPVASSIHTPHPLHYTGTIWSELLPVNWCRTQAKLFWYNITVFYYHNLLYGHRADCLTAGPRISSDVSITTGRWSLHYVRTRLHSQLITTDLSLVSRTEVYWQLSHSRHYWQWPGTVCPQCPLCPVCPDSAPWSPPVTVPCPTHWTHWPPPTPDTFIPFHFTFLLPCQDTTVRKS